MQKWEYIHILASGFGVRLKKQGEQDRTGKAQEYLEILNEAGSDGWEVCGFAIGPDGTMNAILKKLID